MRDAQIDATSVGKAKAFEGEICNACTEMKQKHHIGAVGIATLKAVNCDIFSWSSRVGPTPAPFVTMILEQPDMRAASQMEAKGDTSANGRERKHCQTALEHIALSKKPTGFCCKIGMHRLPVGGLRWHLDSHKVTSYEVRGYCRVAAANIKRMIALET